MKKIILNCLIIFITSCFDDAKKNTTNTINPINHSYVEIYSVTSSPTANEQITIKNYDNTSYDLTGWTLGDLNNPTAYNIPNGTIISSQQTITFASTTLNFQKMIPVKLYISKITPELL